MTCPAPPREHRDEKYVGVYAQPIYRLIKSYTPLVIPGCEDFLYIIKRGVGLRAALAGRPRPARFGASLRSSTLPGSPTDSIIGIGAPTRARAV